MKFSVITVVYNGVQHLEQTIKSVLSQKNVEIQYIIIDGGSTDGTVELIKKYSDKIDYWVSEPDNGLYDAMNKGLEHAQGDVVSFINSDDWYEQDVLKRIEDCFFDETDIVCGRVNIIDNDECSEISGDYPIDNMDILYIRNVFCHQGMFIRKKLFETIGRYNIKYKIAADYDWSVRAYNAGAKFCTIMDVVANYRLGGISDINTFTCEKEFYNIRKINLNGHIEFEETINGLFIDACENEAVRRFRNDNNLNIDELLDTKNSYYIWGAGYRGKECYSLLKTKNIDVLGVVDSVASKAFVDGMKVLSPDELWSKWKESHIFNKDFKIIITPRDYEEKLKNLILSNIDVALENFVFYSDIRKWCYNNYIAD